MRIKRIELNDYKRFHKLTIDLGDNPKRIVALVGPNGCGKSSIFDAMLYKESSRSHIGKSQNDITIDYHSLNNDPLYNSDKIEIEFDKGVFKSTGLCTFSSVSASSSQHAA